MMWVDSLHLSSLLVGTVSFHLYISLYCLFVYFFMFVIETRKWPELIYMMSQCMCSRQLRLHVGGGCRGDIGQALVVILFVTAVSVPQNVAVRWLWRLKQLSNWNTLESKHGGMKGKKNTDPPHRSHLHGGTIIYYTCIVILCRSTLVTYIPFTP